MNRRRDSRVQDKGEAKPPPPPISGPERRGVVNPYNIEGRAQHQPPYKEGTVAALINQHIEGQGLGKTKGESPGRQGSMPMVVDSAGGGEVIPESPSPAPQGNKKKNSIPRGKTLERTPPLPGSQRRTQQHQQVQEERQQEHVKELCAEEWRKRTSQVSVIPAEGREGSRLRSSSLTRASFRIRSEERLGRQTKVSEAFATPVGLPPSPRRKRR